MIEDAKNIRREIRAEMARRGITSAMLAKKIDRSVGHTKNVIEGQSQTRSTRAAIETALGKNFWGNNEQNH